MKSEDDVPQPHSQLFTVRIWPDGTGDDRQAWRGKVQRISNGEAYYFRIWPDLIAHLAAWLADSGHPGDETPTET